MSVKITLMILAVILTCIVHFRYVEPFFSSKLEIKTKEGAVDSIQILVFVLELLVAIAVVLTLSRLFQVE